MRRCLICIKTLSTVWTEILNMHSWEKPPIKPFSAKAFVLNINVQGYLDHTGRVLLSRCVCLLGMFQERIPWGLQELLTETEGSGQEWWEGRRGGRPLYSLGGLWGSHLQAWLNGRMLYDNKNIICLLKGQEKAPLIGFPDSLFYRTSSTEPWFKELSGKLSLSPLVPPSL